MASLPSKGGFERTGIYIISLFTVNSKPFRLRITTHCICGYLYSLSRFSHFLLTIDPETGIRIISLFTTSSNPSKQEFNLICSFTVNLNPLNPLNPLNSLNSQPSMFVSVSLRMSYSASFCFCETLRICFWIRDQYILLSINKPFSLVICRSKSF